MPTVDLSHGTVHYRVAGPAEAAAAEAGAAGAGAGAADAKAPPVVFVHAFLTDGTLWSRVAALLADRGIRSYAPDWPLGSHPVASKPGADLSPRGVARGIVGFLEALGLDDVTLVGNDTGGALCQFVLDEDPSRVGRLVLTNCDGFDVFPPTVFKPLFLLLRSERRIRLLAKQMKVGGLRRSPLGYGLLAHDLPADLTRAWIEPVLGDPGIVRDLARFVRAVSPADLLDVSTRLDRFPGPVSVVWGADDRAFRSALGRRLSDRFTDARFVPVPGSRTFVMLDAPETLADEITAIATRPRTEPAR